MSAITTPSTCCCSQQATQPIVTAQETSKSLSKKRKSLKVISSSLLSFLIAFFPKCPVCWAAYMSMFGSFGLSKIPYTKWLLPLLITFLGIHLFLLFKKVHEKGLGPFAISLAGAATILCGRAFLSDNKTVLLAGALCILAGSLWNSFSFKKINTSSI